MGADEKEEENRFGGGVRKRGAVAKRMSSTLTVLQRCDHSVFVRCILRE